VLKAKKTFNRIGIILMVLLILIILVLFAGDYALNRYLNNGGKETINNALPINGSLNYQKASLHLFKDFPNLTLQLHGLQIDDSLPRQGNNPIFKLEDLYLNASLRSLKNKEVQINSIELSGLSLNIIDQADSYSNLKTLIKNNADGVNRKKNKNGWTVVYDHTDLIITDLHLYKTDEIREQNAHLFMNKILVKNHRVNSNYELSLDMEEIVVANTFDEPRDRDPIQIREAKANLQLEKSFKSVRLLSVELSNAKIDLFTDTTGLSNYSQLLGLKKSKTKPGATNTSRKQKELDLEGADITLNEIDFSLIDLSENKHLAASIINLNTELNVNQDTTAIIDLHLDVDQFAFNTTKGAMLTNSTVKGKIKANLDEGRLEIACPNLSINDDLFNVAAMLPLNQKSATTLTIEKPDALTHKIRPLLTTKIQKSILPYDVKGPFYAKAEIVLTKGANKPRVILDLNVQDKTVIIKGEVIKNAEVSATFVNGFFDDARQHTEHKKNLRLFLHSVSCVYNDFQVETKDALITSSAKDGARLIAKADVTGKASSASHFLKHDKFYFQDGAFTLTTNINGSLRNLDDLIAGTDLNLSMNDMQVFYPEGNTTLPLSILEIKKVGEKTLFEIEGLAIDHGSPIRIQGEIDHLASVLFPGQPGQLQTKADIRASSISWEGLIALFGEDGIIAVTRQNETLKAKRSMKQTLSGIQQSFRPSVKVTIDTVHYGHDVQLLDFHTGLNFEDDKTLVLEETSFKIDKSNVTLDGKVIINQLDFTKFDFDINLQNLDFDVLLPKFDYFGIHLMKEIYDQPDNVSMHIELSGNLDDNAGLKPESLDSYITYESFAEDKFSGSLVLKANPHSKKVDVVFSHSGHPRNINHIFESDDYIFDKGWFNITFEFDDNFESLAQMVEESRIGLTISEAEVYISEVGVTVPLSQIEVASIDNIAYYYLLLKSDTLQQELTLDGVVKNIRHFAFKDTSDSFSVQLNINSPRIVWNDLKQVMTYGSSPTTQQSGKIIKESLAEVVHDFNPSVKLKVDTLEYSDQLSFNNIFAHAYLENDLLKIRNANVSYGESYIESNIDLDISHQDVLPFDLYLELNNIDIAHTLEHFDYFNVPQLESAKQINGNVWFDLDLSSIIDLNNNDFITSKTIADITVKLEDVIIEDLETINNVAEKIRRVDRFNVLKFAPIESHINIEGKRIVVEETEVQSNAIHAFVEGTIDNNSSEHLWISIPVKNIKRPDLDSIPIKTTYAGTSRKVFFKWVSDKSEENGKIKVLLRKKQYYKERPHGINFRDYRREVRRERKRIRNLEVN